MPYITVRTTECGLRMGVSVARPRRITGYSYVGVQRYFLTICTLDRVEYFSDPHVAEVIVDHFLQTAREKRMAVLAY